MGRAVGWVYGCDLFLGSVAVVRIKLGGQMILFGLNLVQICLQYRCVEWQ